RILYLTSRHSGARGCSVERAKRILQCSSALRSLSYDGDSHAASPANRADFDSSCNWWGRGGFVAALRAHNATGPIMQLYVAASIYRLLGVGEGSGDSRVAAPI